MKIALENHQLGLQRASKQIDLASHRIAKWGVDEPAATDSIELKGTQRPRNVLNQRWGRGPDGLSPEVDLSEEALRLKAGEWAFRANIAATKTVLDLEKETTKLLDDASEQSKS